MRLFFLSVYIVSTELFLLASKYLYILYILNILYILLASKTEFSLFFPYGIILILT